MVNLLQGDRGGRGRAFLDITVGSSGNQLGCGAATAMVQQPADEHMILNIGQKIFATSMVTLYNEVENSPPGRTHTLQRW